MKKKIVVGLLTIVMILCIACQSTEQNPSNQVNLETEIQEVLQNASYDNLEILFDDMEYYEGQELEVATITWYNDIAYTMSKETMELYAKVVFPDLMGVKALDENCIGTVESMVYNEDGEHYFEDSYEDVLANLEEYDELVTLVYESEYSSIYGSSNWASGAYISQGVLGKIGETNNPFVGKGILEEEETYDCRIDDLSDSYMLLDGEKTVAEAKEEMEVYFNEHYPIAGRNNGIENEVWSISVGKIKGTDYYAYHGYRTFTYHGIPFTEARTSAGLGPYFSVMGECWLCESDKVDVTVGLINGYTEPEILRTIDTLVPFQEVMDRVAYYLTGETKFQLIYGGLEYRIRQHTGTSEKTMTPSWTFVAKNPNDDTMLKIYVDMETGEINSSSY